MRDLTKLPLLTPEILLGSEPLPPSAGPVRFALADRTEEEQPTIVRECFEQLG
jgi:hypothetical protein